MIPPPRRMMNKLQPCLTEWWWEEYYEVHGLLTSRAALKNLWEATHREDTWSRLASQCSRMSYCWGSKIHFCTSTSSSTSKRAQTFSFFYKKSTWNKNSIFHLCDQVDTPTTINKGRKDDKRLRRYTVVLKQGRWTWWGCPSQDML
jgi:hypothetical protein